MATARQRIHHCGAIVAVGAVLVAGLAGCSPTPGGAPEPAVSEAATHPVGLENLNAVLWVQTAVEYRASAWQAFALAGRVLDEAVADPTWTAALEQSGDFADLPPAVILDVDETVLDNSFFEARLILDGEVYSSELWDPWVVEERASAIPGALEFCLEAAAAGVRVFYVTNRRAHLEEATRNNLSALGFPLNDAEDTILTRGEIPEWEASDKTPRRRAVAEGHRVLMIIGDNMGDFTAAAEGTVAERLAFAERHRDFWAGRWITLANPTYGSFLGAIIDNDFSLTFEEQIELKRRALEPRR